MGPTMPHGQPAGTTTLPSPSPAPETRLRGLQSLGEKARRGRPGSKAPPAGPAAGAQPAPNAAQPRARQFRGAAGPSPTAPSSPGAGPEGQLRGILCTPPCDPRGCPPTRPRAGQRQPARGLARRVSGARGRRGRGGWGRCGWGAGPGAGPHVPLPGGPMGARRSERSPYMDMFWGRARRRPARAPRSA